MNTFFSDDPAFVLDDEVLVHGIVTPWLMSVKMLVVVCDALALANDNTTRAV